MTATGVLCGRCGGTEESLVHNGKRFNKLYDHQFVAPPCEWIFDGVDQCGGKREDHFGAKPFWSHPYTFRRKP